MVQNNNKNEASTFETRFTALEEKVKSNKKDVEAATKSITTVGNKVDTFSKDCQRKYLSKDDPKYKKIEDRLKVLESKML